MSKTKEAKKTKAPKHVATYALSAQLHRYFMFLFDDGLLDDGESIQRELCYLVGDVDRYLAAVDAEDTDSAHHELGSMRCRLRLIKTRML